MNREDAISLYGKRGARGIVRFRLDDPSDLAEADEKVRQWSPWAYKFANQYIRGRRRMADAIRLSGYTIEDVHQAALEGMTKASRVHVKEHGAFSAYSALYMRKEIQRLALSRSVKANISVFTDERADCESPIETLIRDEQSERLRGWLDRLPPLHRDIVMDHFKGVMQDETVERVGLSKLTIRKYRAQALGWLRFFAGVGPKPARPLSGVRYRGTGKEVHAG